MKLLTALLILIPNLLWAQPMKLNGGKTQFLAVGNPGFLKIKGKGKAPEGSLTVAEGKLNGKVTVDLSSLDTGMSLRNEHMKDKYLQVKEFPTASIEFKDAALPAQWNLQKPKMGETKIPGTITIHGQSKPVEVVAKIDDSGQLTSNFEVKITDFKIDIPAFMGVTVADKVKIEIESKLVAEKAN